MERDEGLARRLLVREGPHGHCTYDEAAKRELVEMCNSGIASVAKIALTYGVNANLLHKWIALHRNGIAARQVKREAGSSSVFIPVVTTVMPSDATKPRDLRLDITLDNGTQADLRGLSRDDVLALLPVLAGLPCSGSTRR